MWHMIKLEHPCKLLPVVWAATLKCLQCKSRQLESYWQIFKLTCTSCNSHTHSRSSLFSWHINLTSLSHFLLFRLKKTTALFPKQKDFQTFINSEVLGHTAKFNIQIYYHLFVLKMWTFHSQYFNKSDNYYIQFNLFSITIWVKRWSLLILWGQDTGLKTK